MLAVALEVEVDAYIAGLAGERDERGRRLVVRNGRAERRTITTAAGPMPTGGRAGALVVWFPDTAKRARVTRQASSRRSRHAASVA